MEKTIMRRLGLPLLISLFVSALSAQAPAGYYEKADSTKGAELKTALYSVINQHKQLDYLELWDAFPQTDAKEGKVWDIYSNATSYTFLNEQCGRYREEGQCYNREHSFQKDWFDEAVPMYSDLFHIYPTDGKVNGMRSNYPYGETEIPTYYSENSFSRLGPCTFPDGYDGIVFEPSDLYKGDLARSYFYMVTCYEDVVSGWESPMTEHNSYPALSDWAVDLLLKWSREDPVSTKEKERNEAVYRLQFNRNPFIDYPGLEEYIWGKMQDSVFNLATFVPRLVPDTSVAVYKTQYIIPEVLTMAADDFIYNRDEAKMIYTPLGAYITAAYADCFAHNRKLPAELKDKPVLGFCSYSQLLAGIGKGEVTQGCVEKILPEEHTLVAYLISGKELKSLLNEIRPDESKFLQTSYLQMTIKKGTIRKLEYPLKKWNINDNTECVIVLDHAMLTDGDESFRRYFTDDKAILLFNKQKNTLAKAFMQYLSHLGVEQPISPDMAPIPTIINK